jgi:D-alanyl-D-alanine carboxypeptidase
LKNLLTYSQPAKFANLNQVANYKFSPYPQQKIANANFDFKAKSGIAYDINSGVVLAKKDETKRLPMASITKIFTALVILKNHQLDEVVTIPEGIKLSADDQKLGVTPGQKFKLDQVLKALLIYSANDVAQALAIWDSGSIEKFTDKMNHYAKQMKMENTHFVSPDGTDDSEQYSSSADILKASLILLNNKQLSSIVDTSRSSISSTSGKVYNLTNTNKLLSYSYIHGIKTGFTADAGQSLVTYANKNDHSIITVVLNSPDRFKESLDLINYVEQSYQWQK